MRRWGAIICTLVAVICSVCGFLLFPDLVRAKGYPVWLAWGIAVVFGLCVILLCYIALQNRSEDSQKDEQRLRASEERWIRYGHTRKPNAIVRGLYVAFDWIADFFPMFSALFWFIRKTVMNTWGLLVRTFLVGINIALLVGTIYVSVGHTYKFLTARAGASGISAFVLVFVWEAMFVYCSIRLDYAFRNGDENRSGAWIGFLMGWVFVELTNYFAMADNWYGKAVGLATPVVLLVMKKVLKEQFMKQKRRSLFALWLSARKKNIERKILDYLHKMSGGTVTGVDRFLGETTQEENAQKQVTHSEGEGITQELITQNKEITQTRNAQNQLITQNEVAQQNEITQEENTQDQGITQMSKQVDLAQDRTPTQHFTQEKEITQSPMRNSAVKASEVDKLETENAQEHTAQEVNAQQVTQENNAQANEAIAQQTTQDHVAQEKEVAQNGNTQTKVTQNEVTQNEVTRKQITQGKVVFLKDKIAQAKIAEKLKKFRKKDAIAHAIACALEYEQKHGERPSKRELMGFANCTDHQAKEALRIIREVTEELSQTG